MNIKPNQPQPKRLLAITGVFTIVFLLLSLVIPVFSAPSVFDWDTISWSSSATSQTFTGIGSPATDFAFSASGDISQFTASSPEINQNITGGTSENTLFISVDFLNTTQSITFTTDISPTSATGVSFIIMDIDRADDVIVGPPYTNVEEVEVLGYDFLGNSVLPTLTATNPACVDIVDNVATGTCTDGNNGLDDGNVTVTFNSAIKQVTINFREGPDVQADPTDHGIGIHDISFTPATFLSLNTAGNGVVASDPATTTFEPGEAVTFTATADPGWTFAGWSGDLSGSTNPVTVTMNSDKVVTSTFTQDQYTVTITPPAGGAIDKEPDQSTYIYGDVITFTATANPGWTFANWSGDLSGSANPTTLSVSGNHTVGANFSPIPYTLLTNSEGNGTITQDPDLPTYTYGQVVTVTAVPDPGWTFAGWSGDLSGSQNPTSIGIDSSKAITATFTQNQYTVTINPSTGGSVVKEPVKATYVYGEVITFTATADLNWAFVNWSGDLSGSVNPTTLTVTGNHTVSADFALNYFALSANTIGDGTISKNPDQAVFTHGEIVTVTATADPGWTFAGWSGDLSGNTNPTTITMDSTKSITATFTQNQYTFTIVPPTDGTISIMPEKTSYVYGDVITVTATADSGWTFINWTGDLSGNENPITLEVTGNHTVGAIFKVNLFLPFVVRE